MGILSGLAGYAETTVTEKDTAISLGSGDLPVYGTPAMIALIEYTACSSIFGKLEEEETTVGIKIDASHLKASKVGSKIICKTEITEDDGRTIFFNAEVFSENELIGTAKHVRARVKSKKFLDRLGI